MTNLDKQLFNLKSATADLDLQLFTAVRSIAPDEKTKEQLDHEWLLSVYGDDKEARQHAIDFFGWTDVEA